MSNASSTRLDGVQNTFLHQLVDALFGNQVDPILSVQNLIQLECKLYAFQKEGGGSINPF